jgi:hypothetical protein
MLVQRFAGKLEQRHVTGSLDGYSNGTLVFGTGACLASRPNLALSVNETGKQLCVAVVEL